MPANSRWDLIRRLRVNHSKLQHKSDSHVMGHISLEKLGLHSEMSRNLTCHDSVTNLLLIFSYTKHTNIKIVLLGLWHVH